MTKREQLQAYRERIANLRGEQHRLLQVLEYYAWLEEWGLSWDTIKAVTGPITMSSTIQQEIKNHARRIGKWDPKPAMKRIKRDRLGDMLVPADGTVQAAMRKRGAKAISYKLKDGSEVTTIFPPFPHEVVYNKSLLDAASVAKLVEGESKKFVEEESQREDVFREIMPPVKVEE